MIQFLADIIDQLDLAADQLAVTDRNFDRFALMLVDNVVELTLHRYAQEKAASNQLWVALKKPRYEAAALRDALGRKFDNKVKFARDTGLLSTAVAESLLNLHSFRNTAYHQGRRHEGILHSITIFYFRIACQILKSYRPGVRSWSSRDTLSHRARKYLGDPHPIPSDEQLATAFARLAEVVGGISEDLVGDLAVDMRTAIDTVDDAIGFLSTDGPTPMSRDKVVITSQAWAFAFSDQAKQFAQSNGSTAATVFEHVEWLEKNYTWPFTADPIPSWRRRVQSLEAEADYHAALKKYLDFLRQTEPIRTTLLESASQLDEYIQGEIDRARGK